MSKQNKVNLHDLTVEQLLERADTLRRDLFSLRLSSKTSHVKDISQFKKLRKDIARALTVLQQKRMAAYQEAFFEALTKAFKDMQAQGEESAS